MGFISLYNETSTLMTQMVKNLPEMRRPGFDPWVGRIPWRREWLPTPLLLLGEFHGQRSLTGYSPWSYKKSDIIIIIIFYNKASKWKLSSLSIIPASDMPTVIWTDLDQSRIPNLYLEVVLFLHSFPCSLIHPSIHCIYLIYPSIYSRNSQSTLMC